MPIQMITAWSFSRWQTYQNCPFKAKCKFIDKIPEPPAPAMERGSTIHKLAENFVDGSLKKLPPELKLFDKEFKALKKAKAKVEESWAFTRNWAETSWFGRDAWCRIKMDVYDIKKKTLIVIDHKTGKPKPDHADQLSLYALGGLLKFPEVEEVTPELWYLDHGTKNENPVTYTRDDLEKLKKEWELKVKPMLNDKTFKPKPNYTCRYCPFSKANGGKCKF